MTEKKAKQFMEQVQVPITLSKEKLKIPRARNSNNPLTEEEVKKLIESVDNLRDKTLFVLGFNTGMRVSEITNIPWVAVNKPEQEIRIWDEKKNKYRNVVVPTWMFSTLEIYRKTNPDQERIFEFSTKTAENIIQFWTEKTLGKEKSWHCVRHTYLTIGRMKNTPIEVLSENSGDTPATILRHYVKLPPQFVRQIVNSNPVYSEV